MIVVCFPEKFGENRQSAQKKREQAGLQNPSRMDGRERREDLR